MMLAFVLIAVALAAAAAVLLVLPLMRRREDARPEAITAGLVLVAVFAIGGGLYALLTRYSWEAPVAANTPAAQAAKLARELARSPENQEGWMRLGEMYFDLGQYPLAVRAFQRADGLANGQNPAAISAVAESLLAQDFENIRGAAGRLFERVLEMQPENPKALLYAALAAMGRGETDTARERFERMLAQNPPAQIRSIIEQQLEALAHASAQAGEAPAASPDAQVRVSITVSPSLRYELTGDSALFIAARDPDQPGPPFAARRLPVKFPVEVTLTAADAMLPERRIAAGQTLDVVARISLSGQPQSSSGDPFGQVRYHVGKDGRLDIVIDRLAP